jgi:mercuric ion binding protein
VRTALEAVPGVQQVDVNFDEELASVSYDARKANTETLIAAVKDAGFKAWDKSTEKK